MSGKLTVYTGPMKSGKSNELLAMIERLDIADRRFVVIKHVLDEKRCEVEDLSHIKSRSGRKVRCYSTSKTSEIITLAAAHDSVFIDEIQFFDNTLVDVVRELLRLGKTVWVSGLDMTYTGKPFYNVAMLCAIADDVYKLKSVCDECGSLYGKYSYLSEEHRDRNSLITVGDSIYQTLCSKCYHEKMKGGNRWLTREN